MIEITGDIWDFLGRAVIAITTNGTVTKEGTAVFGRGCARQALERFPNLSLCLGRLLEKHGNHVVSLGSGLVSFPVSDSSFNAMPFSLVNRFGRFSSEAIHRKARTFSEFSAIAARRLRSRSIRALDAEALFSSMT
jgi:hypothetical protein